MKKSLIALAALSAIAGAAQAQSSVEVYGLLDTGYHIYESTGVGAKQQVTSVGGLNSSNGTGALNGTRLGFRGTEDLGGGNKAMFLMEYGVNLTAKEDQAALADNVTGQGLGNLRTGWVGLSNAKLGTVQVGTLYSFVDPTSGSLGATQAHTGTNNPAPTGAAALLKYGQNARSANTIQYTSPSYMGLTAKLGVQQSETISGSAPKANQSNMYAIDYAAGNLKAGYVYQVINSVTNASAKLVDVLGSANDTSLTTGTGLATLTYNVFGGTYDFGFAKLGLNHSDYKNEEVVGGAVKVKSNQNSFSASVPVTAAITLGGAYTDGKIEQAGVKQYGTTGYDLNVVYSLSKRTNVYAMYEESKFDNKVGSGLQTGASIKSTHYGVGVRHSF